MSTKTLTRYEQIVLGLKGSRVGQTAKALGCDIGHLKVLAGKGLVEFAGVEKGGTGRPGHLYKLTSDGKKLAAKLARKVAKG